MNKKTAIKRLIFLSLVIIVGIVLTVVSFPLPNSTYDYKGFANSIKLGLDLKGGVVAVYDCEELNTTEGSLDSKIDATVSRLTSSSRGFFFE